MTSSRTRILDQIRQSLKLAHLPAARATLPPRQGIPAPSSLGKAARVESFTRELTALKGTVHSPRPPAQAIETVIELLRELGGDEILAWADDALPAAGLS